MIISGQRKIIIFLLCLYIGIVGGPLVFGQTTSIIYNSGQGVYDGFWAIEATNEAIYTCNITDCDSITGCAEIIKFNFEGGVDNKLFFSNIISSFECFDRSDDQILLSARVNNGSSLTNNHILTLSEDLAIIDEQVQESTLFGTRGIVTFGDYNVQYGNTKFGPGDLRTALRWVDPGSETDTLIFLKDSILHIDEAKVDKNGLLTVIYNKNEGTIYSSYGLMKFNQDMNEVWHWESGDSVAHVFFASYDLEILDDNSMVYIYDGSNNHNATYAKRVSSTGEVIWERDLMYRYTNEFMWKVYYIGSFSDILRTSDNNLVLIGSELLIDDNGYGREIAFMMKINSDDGTVMWTRWFRDWDEEGELTRSNLNEARELPDGRLAIAGSVVRESFDGLLLITDSDGCLTPDCKEIQNLSEQPETNFIYEGNVWYVVKEDTLGNIIDQYSYTFAEDRDSIYDGSYVRELLKSTDGNITWEGMGRYYRNGAGVGCAFLPTLEPVFSIRQYDFQSCCRIVRTETGGETSPNLMDTITLLDGSKKLRYYENPSPFCDNPLEMIEHVGSITTDPFYPTNDCNSDTLTRVTCLVKNGIVIYANPDYTHCMPLSVEDQPTKFKINIFPNPASDFVKVDSEKEVYGIELLSINGKEILKESENYLIDTSNIQSGLYILKVMVKGGITIHRLLVIE